MSDPRLSRISTREHVLTLLRADGAHPPVRGEVRRALQAEKIRGFLHLYIGEEAIAVGVDAGARARRTRWSRPIANTDTRSHAACRWTRSWQRCSARPKAAAAAAAARCICSMRRRGSMAATPSSAAGCRSRSGLALGRQDAGRDVVTACFFGEGAVAEGEFHESLNLAALWKLPVLFVCENNLYAMGTRLEPVGIGDRHPCKAASYRMPAEVVDGMDVVASKRRRDARCCDPRRQRARSSSNSAPIASARIRCSTPQLYRDKAEVEDWKKRDPIRTPVSVDARDRRIARQRSRGDRGGSRAPKSRTRSRLRARPLGAGRRTRRATSMPRRAADDAPRWRARSPIAKRCARRSATRCCAIRAYS